MQRRTLAFVIVVLIFCISSASTYPIAQAAPQSARIVLNLTHRVLRGEFIVIHGRLSTSPGDFPIALAKIRLQYYRSGEADFTRELVMITSNPGGRFEDRFNTTSLLRIGTWIVNASFPSQLGYESTSTADTFTVVVQPALSLYISSHNITFGQSITFNGLLFACIPCIQDEVTVTFSRPDNTSISIPLRVTPTGGPYPGGYYNGTFTPVAPGAWTVKAVWKGNEVSLPTSSQVEGLSVEAPTPHSDMRAVLFATIAAAVVFVVILAVVLQKRRLRKSYAFSG